jgi:DNA-binding winged helix-turn-helix (wHTH) protein/TolB-like protein/Flp pilus assembly protein TadD
MTLLTDQIYEFGEFRLDVCERILSRNGRPVALTPKSFDTLLMLVRRSGHVVEKDELLREVWPDTFIEEAIIAQNVFALRKVLGQNEQSRYIETVPKRGYRFVAAVRKVGSADAPTVLSTRAPANVTIVNNGNGAEHKAQDFTAKSGLYVSPARRQRRRGALVLLLTFVTGVVALFYWQSHRPTQRVAVAPLAHSMAVLPFKALGADNGDELLGLGMADAIIIKLNHVQPFPVFPTSAIFRYTGREVDPLHAGRELGADAVLTGTVQHVGERVRVTVQLLSVPDGGTLWSGQFDEQFTNIFALQDSISEQVATALALPLTDAQREHLAKRYTENTEAYRMYLLGLYFWNKRSAAGLNQAVTYFQQAIAQDPDDALAYAGLADSYCLIVHYNYNARPASEVFEQAKAAATRALELDETLPEAHMVMAMIQMGYEHQSEQAKRSMRRALELNPNYATAHLRYAWFLARDGLLDEAVREAQRARELDPLSPTNNAALANLLIFARQYDETSKYCRRAIELDPDNIAALLLLGEAAEQQGHYAEAAVQYERVKELTGATGDVLAAFGHLYAVSGRRAEAQRVLEELRVREHRQHGHAYDIALIYAALGRKEQAFGWLEKAILTQTALPWDMRYEPMLDGLRADPRFDGMIASTAELH